MERIAFTFLVGFQMMCFWWFGLVIFPKEDIHLLNQLFLYGTLALMLLFFFTTYYIDSTDKRGKKVEKEAVQKERKG